MIHEGYVWVNISLRYPSPFIHIHHTLTRQALVATLISSMIKRLIIVMLLCAQSVFLTFLYCSKDKNFFLFTPICRFSVRSFIIDYDHRGANTLTYHPTSLRSIRLVFDLQSTHTIHRVYRFSNSLYFQNFTWNNSVSIFVGFVKWNPYRAICYSSTRSLIDLNAKYIFYWKWFFF